ncbi:hypothetical protein J2S48_000011 [Promicromonospora iranensis]|uniref:Uncharacterized protein n=1 Tax=Promicromonospora iranensis TaxID=1105144 RepID=A0ABU2CGR1_9MICO|nr:hypothetical protein [Promicromonospora iranensis]
MTVASPSGFLRWPDGGSLIALWLVLDVGYDALVRASGWE